MTTHPGTVLITGASAGIGKATAISHAKGGATVILLARGTEKSKSAQKEILEASKSGNVFFYPVDLSVFSEIKTASEAIRNRHDTIDILINNAGLFRRSFHANGDGIELMMAVNYLAPFLLTHELAPLLKRSRIAKIINVSSEMYTKGKGCFRNWGESERFNAIHAYADSKVLLNLFTEEISKRLSAQFTALAVHPGVIGTEVFRDYPKIVSTILNLFLPGPGDGAKTILNLTEKHIDPSLSGSYFYKTELRKTKPVETCGLSYDRIWDHSCELVGISG